MLTHKLKIKVDRILLIKILVCLTVLFVFLKDVYSARLHIIFTSLGLVTGSITYGLCIITYPIPKKVYLIWIAVAFMGAFNMLFIGSEIIVNYLPMILLYFPISLYFFYGKDTSYTFWEINYYIYSLFIVQQMLSSLDGYMLFYSGSRNMLSQLLLIWLFILIMVYSNAGKQLPFRFIVIFFIACFIANGRGGMVAAILLAAAYWIIEIYESGKNKEISYRLKLLILLAVLVFVIHYLISNFGYLSEKYLYRFSEKASIRSSEDRLYMWRLYLSKLDNPFNLLFGDNSYSILANHRDDGNLHNSLLMTHARFGIFGVIFVCWAFGKAGYNAIKQKDYQWLILVIVYFIRAMTDVVFPSKIGDVSLWLIVFYAIK